MFDQAWWGAWWEWAILYAVTALLLLGVVVLLYRRILSRRGTGQPPPGICFYLDGKAVMDLYQMGYRRPLEREVQREIRKSGNVALRAALAGFGITADTAIDERVVETYVQVDEPINVIRVVLRVIARDAIHVDLFTGSVRSDRALNGMLRDDNRSSITPTELRDAGVFVSVRGHFREVSKTDRRIVFEAPFGPEGSTSTRARCDCALSDIRLELPDGPFPARCLGLISGWDETTDKVQIYPLLAIFM